MDDTKQAPCRVLVVEDDAEIGVLVVNLLQGPRYDPVWVPTGHAALTALQDASPPPTIILLDLKLPDMDGEDVYAQLEQEPAWREIPVIVISALPGAAARASTLPRATYLPKPFNPSHLLALVAHYCP